jgi:hypothetical protein
MRMRYPRRKTNYWPTLSLLAGIGLCVAFYAWQPLPTGLGFLLDLGGFFLALLGGLALISQFVLPVQTMSERRRVLDHFLSYASGMHGPIVYVKDGERVGTQAELQMMGPGVALLDSASAVVLERSYQPFLFFGPMQPASSQPLVRAAGPGVVFVGFGERIVASLDLRPQTRSTTVQAHTRDGIEVTASISVTFGLLPPPGYTEAEPRAELERNKPAFPFNADSAFRATYGGGAITTGQGLVAWTQLPLDVAVEQFRNRLVEATLDGLFKPNDRKDYPFAAFQAKVAEAVKAQPVLRERGIIIHKVGVGVPQMPRAVMNQRIRAWQARWKKASIQQAAAGESQAIKTTGRWQAQTQETILQDWQAMLARTNDPVERRALATNLVRLLQRTAAEPATRERLSSDTLRLLDALPDHLSK